MVSAYNNNNIKVKIVILIILIIKVIIIQVIIKLIVKEIIIINVLIMIKVPIIIIKVISSKTYRECMYNMLLQCSLRPQLPPPFPCQVSYSRANALKFLVF